MSQLEVTPREQVTREDVEARIRRDIEFLNRIAYRLNREEPFERWTAEDRQVLLLAVMPAGDHTEGPGSWRWTGEGDKANRLLRKLLFLPRKRAIVGRMRTERDAIPADLERQLATPAELVRARLPDMVKLWCLQTDIPEGESSE